MNSLQVFEITVDGWNLANQLRLVVYPIVYSLQYKVLTPSLVVQDFFHQQYLSCFGRTLCWGCTILISISDNIRIATSPLRDCLYKQSFNWHVRHKLNTTQLSRWFRTTFQNDALVFSMGLRPMSRITHTTQDTVIVFFPEGCLNKTS